MFAFKISVGLRARKTILFCLSLCLFILGLNRKTSYRIAFSVFVFPAAPRAPPARPSKSSRFAMDLLTRAPRAPFGNGGHEGIKFWRGLLGSARPPRAPQNHRDLQWICSRAPLARPLATGGTKASSFEEGSWVLRAPRAPPKVIAICNESAHARPACFLSKLQN